MPPKNSTASTQSLTRFRRRLLAWYAARKRDLPWRRTGDPYRIWISEIMLQQTRVAAVIPYYERFVARFPTIEALARAQSETVLSHWAGLGYYSRARNLHRAAKEIVTRHDGHFPQELSAALELPGIGNYTAAAVLSIAYRKPLAVLDGNVARVLARVGTVRGELREPANWKTFMASAARLLARRAPGDWNQAMMELGATICTPKSPRCAECPLAADCLALKLGVVAEIPSERTKRAGEKVTLSAAVLLDPQGRTLLVRETNGDGALFANLWQFPAVATNGESSQELQKYLLRYLECGSEQNSIRLRNSEITTAPIPTIARITPLEGLRHTVTFRDIRLEPFLIHVDRLPDVEGMRSPLLSGFAKLTVSNATRKIGDAVLAHLKEESSVPPDRSRKLRGKNRQNASFEARKSGLLALIE